MDESKVLPINEAYVCTQGEGILTGVPSILIRFSGCRLRCQFENSCCDTWYSSWTPEKGSYSIQSLRSLFEANPQIRHAIVSGGGPTLHKKALPQVLEMLFDLGIHTTLETEGSEFIEMTEAHYPSLLSLSPKLANSTPKVGSYIAQIGRHVEQRDRDIHEKYRCNYEAMSKWIDSCDTTQVKFVISNEDDIKEALLLCEILDVRSRGAAILFMPEGMTNEDLQRSRLWLEGRCIDLGVRYCERVHVVVHGNKRGV